MWIVLSVNSGHLGELGLPGGGEALAVGFDPVALRHHLQRKVVLLHRPDQPHAPFDLAVVEHEARRRDLHGGAARALVDQQHGAGIGEAIERLIQRHRTVALALGDGQQARLRAGAGMGVDRAPVGDDEALGAQRLQPDIVGADAIAPSMRAVSSCSNAVNRTFWRSIVSANSLLKKVVIGGTRP